MDRYDGAATVRVSGGRRQEDGEQARTPPADHAPRIRDLKDRRIFTIEKPSRYGELAPLVGGTVRTRQIATYWEEVLRLASSVRAGTVTASLILGKLAAYPRRNGLAWARKEIGKIERSIFYLERMKSPDLRRCVTAGLNKGETRNALARAVFFNRLGEMRDRSHEDQTHWASGLKGSRYPNGNLVR